LTAADGFKMISSQKALPKHSGTQLKKMAENRT
jgi:hypothetical protein